MKKNKFDRKSFDEIDALFLEGAIEDLNNKEHILITDLDYGDYDKRKYFIWIKVGKYTTKSINIRIYFDLASNYVGIVDLSNDDVLISEIEGIFEFEKLIFFYSKTDLAVKVMDRKKIFYLDEIDMENEELD